MYVAKYWDDLSLLAVKGKSKSVIAGFLRNRSVLTNCF